VLCRGNEIELKAKRFGAGMRIPLASMMLVSFFSTVQMKILVAAAFASATGFAPAHAATMKCTAENMAKSTAMMTPEQSAVDKEPWKTPA
jgi:hypothetical protein